MTSDRFDAMEAFVAVADLKGFARAARQLKASDSKVTRLVAKLEARLGVELFRRTTRVVTLTDAGARLLPSARTIIEAVSDVERTSRQASTRPSGRLSISAPLMFGRLHVAPLLSRFLARFPAVRAQLLLVDRVVNLVEEGVDAAVRIGQLADSGLKSRILGSTRRVLVASSDYLERHGKPRTPDELRRHALIEVTQLAGTGWHFGKGREQRTLRPPPEPAFATNSADAAIEHALNGGGVAMLLAYQVLPLLRAGRLQLVLPRFEPEPSPIQIVYASSRQPSANVRAFIDFAVQSVDWNFKQLDAPR